MSAAFRKEHELYCARIMEEQKKRIKSIQDGLTVEINSLLASTPLPPVTVIPRTVVNLPTPPTLVASMKTLIGWQTSVLDSKQLIVQASNPDGSDSWTPFPIGMGWAYVLNNMSLPGSHDKLVLCAVSSSTDSKRRPAGINRKLILENLAKNNINNSFTQAQTYFSILPSYKFVISPEGNGIDCHRTYEALIAGCIPVLERNPLTEQKYKGCPVLWTVDYSEINEEYLNKKYAEMINKVYDFSCLLLSSYSLDLQHTIMVYGNFWLQKTCKRKWY